MNGSLTRSTLILILLLGAVARAIMLPLPGTRDVPDWKATAFVASEDILRVYGAGGWPPEQRVLVWRDIACTTEYPPFSQLQMATVGRIYRAIDPEFHDGPLLTTLIKMPGLLAEIILVIALLTWGRRVMGAAAEWAAVAFWLNPGVWLTGSVLGYLDAQMAVPATLALLAAASDRPRLAGLLGAIAVLTKPQAVFILPILLVMVLCRDGRLRIRPMIETVVTGSAVGLAAILPFVFAGTGPSFLRAVQRLGAHDLVSGTATNVWWLLTWALGSAARLSELGLADALSRPATMVRISTAVAEGVPNPRIVGMFLTVMAFWWVLRRSWRGVTLPVGALVGAWCVLAYFMLSGQVHENHSYLALPILGLAAAALPRLRTLYWLITAAYCLNLYLFYGFGMTLPPVFERSWTFIDASVLLSIAYIGLVVWLTIEVKAATAVEVTGPATPHEPATRRSRPPQSRGRGRSSARQSDDH